MSAAAPSNGVTRSYSFSDHSTYQPDRPHPGDRIDAEFDTLYHQISLLVHHVQGLARPAHITPDMLDPAIQTTLNQGVRSALQQDIDRIHAALAYANAAADRAQKEATRALSILQTVQQLAEDLNARADDDDQARADALSLERTAEDAATDAENSANHALESEQQAKRHEDLAGAWAEWMDEGAPIPPRFFAHTDITGDHWSSRWWANRAAAAFGKLSELYLGVWPYPPTSTSTGDPIPLGAIYYNSTLHQVFVWDGVQWQPFWAPSKAYTFSLIYKATAGQTDFPLTTPDWNGEIWEMTPGDPEILEVYVNGVRALWSIDWTVDNDTSTVIFAQPVLADTMVLVDILVSPNRLAPGRVSTLLLLDFDIDPVTGDPGMIDGTRTLFYLARASDRALVPVSLDTDVQIFIDGAVQKPGADYSTLDDTITFAEPPLPGATAWGILFAPEVEATVRAGDRAHVVRYRSRRPTPKAPSPEAPEAPEAPVPEDPRQVAYAKARRARTDAFRRPADP